MDKEYSGIIERFNNAKAKRSEYTALWSTISRYTGITFDINYFESTETAQGSKQLDEFVEDPTSAISINQFGDYLVGIMWGTGQNAFKLKPSRYVTELIDEGSVQEFYDYATNQSLYHMNHERAGLSGSLQRYSYSTGAFGTAGIGSFPNQAFKKGIDENALIFRDYGVDNIAISEGSSGLVDYVYVKYNWTATKIVNEFCFDTGVMSDKKISLLPKEVKDAWNSNAQKEFPLICALFPRNDFNPKLQGKKGTRYKGVWFLEDNKENIFAEDDYKDLPINVARSIKIRGEVYGRSSATLLISSIRALNFILGNTIEILEKMSDPAMGMWDGSIGGDNVVDTSSRGLTVFNPSLNNGQQPMWQLYDTGDPSGVIQFLVPYLKESITTASKVDALLDYNSEKEMTATESLQRYAIRGKSLSGLLMQQKNELLLPLCKRSVNILWDLGELGIDPKEERAYDIKQRAPQRIIPNAVTQVVESGKPWYEIEFNNELENLTRTQYIERLMQFANALQIASTFDQAMVASTDMYKWLEGMFNNLGLNDPIMVGEVKFNKDKAMQQQMQQQMMAMQAGQAGAEIEEKTSKANKNNKEASNVG